MTDLGLRAVPNEDTPSPGWGEPARQNGNGKHTPHSDVDAERALISAALFGPGIAETVTNLGVLPEHFIGTTHAAVWQAICDVVADGGQPDVFTVADRVHADHGHVDQAQLAELQATPLAYPSNAARYADIVLRHATTRRARAVLEAASEAVRLGADPHDVLAKLGEALPAPPVAAKESLVADMQAVLDGEADVILPNLAPRDDHATCLLYAPGINWFDGEPGKGKSMLAQWWVYRELEAGRAVVYIAYEGEGNRHQFGARLKQMGLTDASRLFYIHRSGSWSPTELAELRDIFEKEQPSLVVVDSVASAMEAEGLDPESNRDVERWKAAIPAWAVKWGAGFLAVDHLTKNPETRGRYSIGAQRKLGISDVSYRLLMHQEAGLGRTGFGRLEVMKDREGALGAFQEGRVIAEVSIASERRGDTYELRVALMPPAAVTGSGAQGPTWYMERISSELEAHGPIGKVELRTRIGQRKDLVDLAIERLLDEGAIEVVEAKGRAKPYRSVYPWRAPAPAPSKSFYEADDDI